MGFLTLFFRSIQSHRRRKAPKRGSATASAALESRLLLAAKVIVAPATYEFRDMGFDPATQEVGIVGYEGTGIGFNGVGVTKFAKLFELNSLSEEFTVSTPVGLGNPVYVYGISSDASRIAGQSKSPGSHGEGTTWLRKSINSPIGIGAIDTFGQPRSVVGYTSDATSAWAGGVVGSVGGGYRVMKWTPEAGPIPMGNPTGRVQGTWDVNADGSVTVGFVAGSPSNPGGSAYWDSDGIHALQDPYGYDGLAMSISPNGEYIGGWVGEVDALDNDYLHAAVWDSQRNLIMLKTPSGGMFEGKVLDVSNHGYAVGHSREGRGFIWHPSFDGIHSQFTGVQYFDDWLLAVSNTVMPFASKSVKAIAEDPVDGQLLFCLTDATWPDVALTYQPGASAFVEVDVAGIADSLVVTSAVHQGKLPENVVSTGIATLEVGLRGSVTFDVTKLDRASLFIGDERNTTSGKISSVKIKDMDGDGIKDAIISLKSTGTLRSDTSRLRITGRLTDGTTIDGTRTVTSTTQSVNAYWQATTGTEWRSMLSAYTRGLKKTWW